ARGLKLITGIKSNMKNMLMMFEEKLLLRKRSLVETVFDYLKNKFMLEHSRHRSFSNMLIHIISTLIANLSLLNPPLQPNITSRLIHNSRYKRFLLSDISVLESPWIR
ncbi:MAG: transposase, partial [Holosporaceae bacterium]|nr:transposase [Holosporaceae bacterium]